MAGERRASPRVPARLQTEVRFTSWLIYSLIYTVNISKGGMSLELPEKAEEGASLEVKLLPPLGPAVTLDAIVRHSRRAGNAYSVGVQFQNLDDEKRATIENAIRAHGGMMQTGGIK
jgi:hypothetical protein